MIETRGGFASPLQELTVLPEFIVYADGTAIWTRYDKKKDLRQMFTVHLSDAEISQEISFINSAI